AELAFRAGDVIHVFGDMDDDGFYYGDLNGRKGLVPSNFLQALSDEAPPPPAQPAAEPRRDPQQERLTTTTTSAAAAELLDPEPPATPGEPGGPEGTDTDPQPVDPAPDPGSDPATDSGSGHGSPLPSDMARSEAETDSARTGTRVEGQVEGQVEALRSQAPVMDGSPLGKKKKSFFSKGRRLFKRLGSGKKD
ncbi:hypothetical protein CRUP_001257, partial [Coryphaenoides rupestris]